MVGTLPCCACAPSGHAAAPPSSVMNSRRFIMLPSGQGSQHAVLGTREQHR